MVKTNLSACHVDMTSSPARGGCRTRLKHTLLHNLFHIANVYKNETKKCSYLDTTDNIIKRRNLFCIVCP